MDVLRRWRQWIRPTCFTFYFICLMIAVPLCILELNRKGAPDHVQAWFIGGIFVMMAVPISFWGILQHLIYYTQPELQRHIIRVLWMVPIYALNAWFALRFPSAAIYLDTLRECYEAYVIYNFMRYLVNFLHQEHPQLDLMLENKPRVKHFIPFCCLPPWPPGKIFLNRCKHGVLQYTVVRPAMTVVALISQLAGKYDEGNFNFTSTWSYIVIINNVSQLWAMYCLVLFYKATKEELQPINPVPKFLCVKAVVFLSFWQSTVIAALAKLNVIPSDGTWVFYHSVEEVATGLQDFLICLEMFLAAIAHYYSFSHLPFADAAAQRGDCCSTFFSMWDVRDVRDDVIDHARYIGRGVQKKLIRSKMSNSTSASSERTPLLASQSSSIMVNPGSSSIQEPSTPPIVVEEKQNAPGAYDTQSMSEAEWERSSETFHVKSTTPSMVNYAEFSTSVDMSTTAAGAATEGASGADRGAGDSGNGDLLGEGEGNSSEQGAGDSGSVDLLGEGEENSSEQGAGDSGSVDLLGEGEGNSSEQGAGDSGSVDLLGEGEENSSEQGESAGAKNREDDIPGDELEGSVEKSTTVIA